MGWQDAPLVSGASWESAPLVEPKAKAPDDLPSLNESGQMVASDGSIIPESDLSGDGPIEGAASAAVDVGKDVVALADVSLVMATAGVAEIGTGFAGAVNTVLGRPIDETRAGMDYWSDFLTYQPKSKRGGDLLASVAPVLSSIEDKADKVSFSLAMGNPHAATIIKTALLGGVELVVPGKTAMHIRSQLRDLARKNESVSKAAEKLGIPISSEKMAEGIVDAAKKMTPEQRAENTPAIRDAMSQAKEQSRLDKEKLFNDAAQTRTYIKTGAIDDLNVHVRQTLEERQFDVEDMPIVQKRLADLAQEVDGSAVRLNELYKIRKRINANRSSNRSENLALDTIKRNIDSMLDAEFNKDAMGAGSAIIGDRSGIEKWRGANNAHRVWKESFFEDKAIAQLIEMDATPEMYRQWIMGASAMNARKEAGSTIKRMRGVLGENHPAIEGIRQDFLYEMAEPLLQETPNFNQFITNYDRTLRRNPTLASELGLKDADLRQLVDFAKVQSKLPPTKATVQITDFTKALAQFFVGHNIAKASLRVNMSRGIANMLFGVDRVSRKQMLSELVGVRFGEPAIPKKSPLAAQFIASAALTGIDDE